MFSSALRRHFCTDKSSGCISSSTPCSCGTASSGDVGVFLPFVSCVLSCVRVFFVSLGQISSAVCCWHVVRSVHNSNHGSRRENQVPFTGKALDGGDGNLILGVLSFHSRNFFG